MLWAPVLWSMALLLPASVQAQHTTEFVQQKHLARKLAPQLHHIGYNSSPASYRIQVKEKQAFYTWLKEQQVGLQVTEMAGHEQTLIVSRVRPKQLLQLLASPEVIFIDQTNRSPKEELELKDADFVANNVYAAQGNYPQLTGEGMAVSVKENPFNPADIDLKGRVLEPQTFGSTPSVHATTMATLIAGAGNSSAAGKGVTWKSNIAYSDFAELYPDDSEQLLRQGISVQNHSYGVGVENYYGLEAQAYDRQIYRHPQLLHVFSSGNSGDKADANGTYANFPGIANLTGQFKTSKNTLSVGALEPTGEIGIRSSRGPAYDGRIKPELVAHGTGGTSEAAAVVSGIALLVQQAYKEKYGSLPPASLVKAALINSSNDVGRPGPDFESGFGNADALGAIRAIQEQRLVLGTIAQGETKTYQLNVPLGVRLLKATIVWHEPEAEPNAEKALLNDLDLTLRHTATANTWRPWVLSAHPHPDSLRLPARRGVDRLNNVEQVTLTTPTAGAYTLNVTGHRVSSGPQNFSLVYEFKQGTEWLYPTAGASLQAGALNRITWQGTPQTGKGRLEYRLAGSGQWQTITDALDLSTSSYTWQAPDAVSLAQLRLTAGSSQIVSEQFVLSQLLQLQEGFNCEEQVMLHWPKLPDVQQYQLSYLGETHLQPLLTITDTLVILDKSSLKGSFIAVAPNVQGIKAQNSPSIPIRDDASGCYVISFLPRQLVMDTVQLELELSTLYQLASFSLERLENNTFKTIQTLSPVTQLQHLLTDPRPGNGRNIYRIKVSTTAGQTYYSQQEEVIYAKENFLQVYPNPVAIGQPFFVAVASESAQITLHDPLGRLVQATNETGVIKEVQTRGLTSGLYIIRLKTEDGTYLTGKVLLL